MNMNTLKMIEILQAEGCLNWHQTVEYEDFQLQQGSAYQG